MALFYAFLFASRGKTNIFSRYLRQIKSYLLLFVFCLLLTLSLLEDSSYSQPYWYLKSSFLVNFTAPWGSAFVQLSPDFHLTFLYALFGCSRLREKAVTFKRSNVVQEFSCRSEAYPKSPNLLFKLFKVFLDN